MRTTILASLIFLAGLVTIATGAYGDYISHDVKGPGANFQPAVCITVNGRPPVVRFRRPEDFKDYCIESELERDSGFSWKMI